MGLKPITRGLKVRSGDSTSSETPAGCVDTPNALGNLLGALVLDFRVAFESWPTLPEAIRAVNLAMVKAAGK
jgi:hypothetical protein